MGGYSLGGIILRLLAFILVFLIQFFMTITLAYLAVSVCSTILQTKKIKGFISFVLFIVFYVILSVIASKIPHLSNPGPDATFMEAMYAMIPQITLYFVVMVASYIGSSVLLEKNERTGSNPQPGHSQTRMTTFISTSIRSACCAGHDTFVVSFAAASNR